MNTNLSRETYVLEKDTLFAQGAQSISGFHGLEKGRIVFTSSNGLFQ